MSYGALMGARGNSGVILSQVFRGFSKGLKGKTRLTAQDWAAALREAAATAYQAVLKPVEGTMLTVIREMAEGAEAAAGRAARPALRDGATVEAGRPRWPAPPNCCDKLRDAGRGGRGRRRACFVLLRRHPALCAGRIGRRPPTTDRRRRSSWRPAASMSSTASTAIAPTSSSSARIWTSPRSASRIAAHGRLGGHRRRRAADQGAYPYRAARARC